ncbi:MAG: 50S ribosomal protein L3 [Candidatus Omnitrophica bacterium]|nr:50S ribosomal protein L3 [Candidatus Omnitrophota bacterium]
MSAILGKKIGMVQIFDEKGDSIPVTVLEAGPCVVQLVKTVENDGYNAVQFGFDDKRAKRVKKPQAEYLKSKNLKPKRFVREVRCDAKEGLAVGDTVQAMFQKGDFVDVIGISKGKGFQGGMKRNNWLGGCETHGSMSHRAPGSIGASSYPKKVERGHPMPGQMGNEKSTMQNLKVVDVDVEKGIILVRGAVPGANGNYCVVRFAKKKKVAPRQTEKKETKE